MMQVSDRFMQQLEKACDEMDGKNPDHDLIRDRIATVMAAAAYKRVQIMEDMMKEKTIKATKMLEKKKDNATPKS
jgi:hypothetical protein